MSWSVAVVLADWQVSGCCLLAGAMIGCHAPKDDSDGVMGDVVDAVQSSDYLIDSIRCNWITGSFLFPARPQLAMFPEA